MVEMIRPPFHQNRRRRGRRKPKPSHALRRALRLALTAGVVMLLALVLLAWLMWQALLWLQSHPLAGTALWASALALGLLAACGLFYWTYCLPPPGLRWHHPRRADLARYYDRRGTLQALQAMDPLAFERYVGQLFEREGYRVEYTPRSGDGGVDLLLRRRKRGWRSRGGEVALAQCKRYAANHPVGSPELQQFSGALRRALAYEGYVVTTGFFTPAAQEWARQEGIHLIDGLALLQWQCRLERRAWLRLRAFDR